MNATALPVQNESVPTLDEIVEKVSHLLPNQAPLRRFVHHNTLHHFEDQCFEDAVEEAAKVFGCQPYPTEAFFAKELARGRIQARDVAAVSKADTHDHQLPFKGWSRTTFRSFRLQHLFPIPSASEIRYGVFEGDLLERCVGGLDERFLEGARSSSEALTPLWNAFLEIAPVREIPRPTRSDHVDRVVQSVLIKFCAAYLDQGVCYWPMPHKDGLYRTFARLYSQKGGPSAPELRGLCGTLASQQEKGWSAEHALEDAILRLGITTDDRFEALLERALSLRGWAGMVYQMEVRPDLAPVEAPPVRLLDYLAVSLILEAQVLEAGGFQRPTRDILSQIQPNFELAYEAFHLAQLAGLGPSEFQTRERAEAWLNEVAEFPDVARRRTLLLAYERRYRIEILEGIRRHTELGFPSNKKTPRFQAVFCIDDREESLRRHLEEIEKGFETLGYAGFFGVCMTYQGWNDTHPQPLCPANQTPMHLVLEVPLDPLVQGGRRALGGVRQTYRAGRNSLVRGGLLSAATGVLAGVPLVGRTLFPGAFHRLEHALEHQVAKPPRTRLQIERGLNDKPNEKGLWEGFLPEEMTTIVRSALSTMGCREFAALFVMVGHGSSSLNNPHEAAHDCGATGGGRGGPNARAFAAMANHPQVRKNLAETGLVIPNSTWFVGGYHNTCDDSMEYYDTDLIPDYLQSEFSAIKEAMAKACVMDAHERCRRFDSVSKAATPAEAFAHVQSRAVMLAQPRPEYGHCTNSICIVGRRERTRGLFLDRRTFLVSYDPRDDAQGMVLGNLLESVGPVGAGINLEYYFSSVDNAGYGCGTKLPHNITGLLGVMDGHASDLRTGLPWQMVEIHEPMRLLVIVEAKPELLSSVLKSRPCLKALVDRGWIQMIAWDPDGPDLFVFGPDGYRPHEPDDKVELPVVEFSRDYYGGHRGHLPPARVRAGL